MTLLPLNTPIQAQHLAYLYGVPAVQNPKWLLLGTEDFIETSARLFPSSTIYGVRSWDESKIKTSVHCHGMYLHMEHDMPWSTLVKNILAKDICVIRHGLPIGAHLKQAYDMIPQIYRAHIPRLTSFGVLMNRLSMQKTPENPIGRSKLSTLLIDYGWEYVCDLCTYRDFGHEDEDIEKRDVLSDLVWRDSLFIRKPPIWSLHTIKNCTLNWRIASKKKVNDGYVYTTPEGLQLGVRGGVSLEEYSDWNVLCSELTSSVYSFIHSGLLSLGESK